MLAAVLAVLLLCACGGQPSREPNPPEPPEEAPYDFTLDYHRCAPLVEKKIGSDLVAAARLVIDAFLAGETSVTLPEGDYGGNPGNDLGYALNSMCPAFGAVTDYDDYHFDTETCTVTWAYTQTPEQVRTMIFWLGVANPEKLQEAIQAGQLLPQLHNECFAPQFADSWATGVQAMAKALIDLLQ